METLKLLIYAYLSVGIFNLIMTIFMVFKSRKSHEHKQKLTNNWNHLWNMPGMGKFLAILTIIISVIWLVIGWPYGIRKGFKRLKDK